MAGKPSLTWNGLEAALLAFGDDVERRLRRWQEIPAVFPGRTPSAARVKCYELRAARDAGAPRVPVSHEPVILPPPPERPAPPDPVERERDRLANMAALKQQRDLLREVAGEKGLRAALEKLVADAALPFDAPPPYVPPRAVKASDADGISTETMVLCLSDWHAYELVSSERTRGFNSYDADEFGRRARRVVATTLDLKRRLERGGYRFPRLVVGLNGDLVSGTIHEVEWHTDAPSVVHAVYGCGIVLAQALRDLAAAFGTVEVFATPGNHGRLPDARRMQQKSPWRSWDTLIALFAKEHLRALGDRLQWYIPDSYSVAFEVEGWRFLQTHGHDVKSWMGIPFYGLNRLLSTINALEAGRGTPLHYVLAGHFHNQAAFSHAAGELFVNGSLIGATEFSVQALGRADPPRQWLLQVHREHGVTARWPILADAPLAEPGYAVRAWDGAKCA